MAATLRRRGAAALAVATVSGMTLAASVPAGAATSHSPAYYSGAARATAVAIKVNIPSVLQGVTDAVKLPAASRLDLVSAQGTAVRNTMTNLVHQPTSSVAKSILADSNIPLVHQLGLDKTLEATLSNPLPKAINVLRIAQAPVADLTVGPLNALVQKATTANSSSAAISVGHLLTLGNILDTSQLQQLVDTLNAPASAAGPTGVVTQVTDVLDQLLQQLAPVTDQSPVALDLSGAIDTLKSRISTLLDTDIANTSLINLSTVVSKQTTTPATGVAEAVANVNHIDILGNGQAEKGLISVDDFQSKATAVATSHGTTFPQPTGLKSYLVRVGTPVLTATLDSTGLHLSDVVGLPASVTDQVNALLGQLNTLLNQLLTTLGVQAPTVTPWHVATDPQTGRKYAVGQSMDFNVGGTGVLGQVLDQNTPLVGVSLGQTTATGQVKQAPKIVKVPNPQQGALPHTGANLPLIGGGGLALLVAAAVLRRRFA